MSVNGVSEENIRKLIMFGHWLSKVYCSYFGAVLLESNDEESGGHLEFGGGERELCSEDGEPTTSTPLQRLTFDERIEASRSRFFPDSPIPDVAGEPQIEIPKNEGETVENENDCRLREESGYVSGAERSQFMAGSSTSENPAKLQGTASGNEVLPLPTRRREGDTKDYFDMKESKFKEENEGLPKRSPEGKCFVWNQSPTYVSTRWLVGDEEKAMGNHSGDKYRESYEDLLKRHRRERFLRQPEGSKRFDRSTLESTLYMDVEPLKRRNPRPAGNYRTKDDDENRHNDINNPDWDDWKMPRNDRERLNHVQRRFGNLVPADPSRCLTFHGYRRQKAAEANGLLEYETGIRDPRKIEVKDGKIEILQVTDPRRAEGGKRKATSIHEEAPDAKRRRRGMSLKEYEAKMIEVLKEFKKPVLYSYLWRKNKAKADAEWKYCLRHFKGSLEETFNFAKYYSYGDEYRPVMSWDEFDRSRCTERIFSKFAEHYGPNRLDHCKDCSEMENRKVLHQY